mmetsp:Transcript_114183/g.354461  ORF Transcript_114183/g.354461 Transcript_114183/m.354461 type:complete len:93 (-) Transcript_114183:65-343(-)
MACRLAVVQVLPRLWRQVGRQLAPGTVAGPAEDPFGSGLRPLYKLYEVARRIVRQAGPAPGDLRPARCEAVDFNAGTVWDQPWERSSRRFKL